MDPADTLIDGGRAGPLNEQEQADLKRLESEIADGLRGERVAGAALAEIRDRRLYRESYRTFEAYVEAEWPMSRADAYRRIKAAKLADLLYPNGDDHLPEGVLRHIPTGLSDEDKKRVYERVKGSPLRVTGKVVRQAVREVQCGGRGPSVEQWALLDKYAWAAGRAADAVKGLEKVHGEPLARLERDAIADRCGAKLAALRDRVVKVVDEIVDESRGDTID